jgi:hypothetical protein
MLYLVTDHAVGHQLYLIPFEDEEIVVRTEVCSCSFGGWLYIYVVIA